MSSDLNDFNMLNYRVRPDLTRFLQMGAAHVLINCACISILSLLTFAVKTAAEDLLRLS